MYLAKIYDPEAREHRVRYAIASILRDRVANEGAFKICFEMGDEDAVIRTILRRGLRNLKLRTALERSHLINLTHWLTRYPDLAEAYYSGVAQTSGEDSARRNSLRTT
jgi:cystathionine beta-lyase/cystathionine gamma-synthase